MKLQRKREWRKDASKKIREGNLEVVGRVVRSQCNTKQIEWEEKLVRKSPTAAEL